MKSKISICFLTIVVILLALVMIEKINTQRAADKAAIIAQSNENDKEEKNEKESEEVYSYAQKKANELNLDMHFSLYF